MKKIKEKYLKSELLSIIIQIAISIPTFIFLWYVTTPQTIIWLEEATLSCMNNNLKCTLLSIKVLFYNIGAMFIFIKLFIIEKWKI